MHKIQKSFQVKLEGFFFGAGADGKILDEELIQVLRLLSSFSSDRAVYHL